MWKAIEKGIVQITRLILEIALARLLMPDDFGVFAIVLTFIALSNIIIEGGLGSSLIQIKIIDERDASTVLYILLVVSAAVYVLIFLFSPQIGKFYKIDNFDLYIRVLSISLFPSAYNSVQNALATRNFQFKTIFKVNAITILISGAVAIILAYLSFGIWVLIIQYFIQILLSCILMNIYLKWRPQCIFSFKRGKMLFSYGWKLMLSNLLNRGYGEIYNLIIGKVFNTTTLGYYTRGKMLPGALENGLTSVLTSVLFPAFAQNQENIMMLKKNCSVAIRLMTFIIAPIFFGMAATSTIIVELLLTAKWNSVAPIMEILSFGFVFQPISHINTTAINGLGRSDVVLKLEIVKRLIGVGILLITMNFGIIYVAVGLSFSYIINMFLNCYANKLLINMSFIELIKDILPPIVSSTVMYICVKAIYLMGFFNSMYITLLVQIVSGIIIYFALAFFLNKPTLELIFQNIKRLYNSSHGCRGK